MDGLIFSACFLDKTAALVITSIVAFLLAAKAHGREIRLVREAAGHHSVVFGRSNGPFVDALWDRERLVFWVIAGVVFVAVAIVCSALSVSMGRAVWAALFVPSIAAFVLSGVRHGPNAAGFGWWAATILVAAVACVLARG